MSNNKHGDAGKFSFARRRFLQNSAYAVGGLSFISPFSALLARAAESAAPDAVADTVDYLVEVADRNTGLPLLKLPEGFEYVSFGWTGDPLQDDFPTPGSHDGMAVIRSRAGRIVLARNHEIWGDEGSFGKESIVYDPRAGAGTTNLLFNAMTGELETSWISLGGTLRNCAGGPTPWGTWLTCEEIMLSPGDIVGSGENARAPKIERDHGFIFEVKPRRGTRPEPLVDMGRFYHEAAAVDPRTGIVYETEDSGEAGLYRFMPNKPGKLHRGGRLQMMQVMGHPDMRTNVDPSKVYSVAWVDIADPVNESGNYQNPKGVFNQGKAEGATTFTRLEGCWFADGVMYFASTDGGNAGLGQVYVYSPTHEELRLVYESPDAHVLDSPDNIAVSPNGGLVVCEDGARAAPYMMSLSKKGILMPIAQNNVQLDGSHKGISGDFRSSEWAGANFSPDGKWLFVNIQTPGITFAITGPWEKFGL